MKVHWFKENEQVGWVRSGGAFSEQPLPGFMNIDIHLSKKIEYYLKFTLSLSARNILNDKTVLQGIALRDRRFYLGIGLEY